MRLSVALEKISAVLLILLLAAPITTLAQKKPDKKKPADKKTGKQADKKKPEGLPLKPARTIKFTTDEGTWMSLDVSPDGKTIVFDMLGDIYTLPVAGGTAKKIIGGMSFDSQPKFSPDGTKIVFLSDRTGSENVWVANPDGSKPKAITTGVQKMYLSPSWTEDGKYVIASRSDRGIGVYHTYMYHIDGGSGVSIGKPPRRPTPGGPPTGPNPNKMGAVASPDGKYVYFAQRNGVFNYNARFPLWQIVRFDRETSETLRLTNAQGSAMRPVLSPDGKNLVFATRHDTRTALRVRNLETSRERWLIDNVTRDDQEARGTMDVFPGYAFMPDGKSLIVPKGGKIHRVDFATGESTVIPFTANVEVQLGPRVHFDYQVDDSAMVRARLIRHPVLSPDGKSVVFTVFNKVYKLDVATGTSKRLTSGTDGEFMPTISPDGKTVAYVTWSNKGGHIYSVGIDGGTPKRLTNESAYYSYPVYSPDGGKIAFISGSVDDHLFADLHEPDEYLSPEHAILHGKKHNGEITGGRRSTGLRLEYIPSSGGNSKLIAPSRGGRYPHFSKDPNRIFVTTRRGLVSMRLDGFDRKTHINVTGVGQPPLPPSASAIMISPDEKRAFVELQGKHYIVTIPKVGKDAVRISLASPKSNVPVKKMSKFGGDYLSWARNGKTVTWAWGTTFYHQSVGDKEPKKIDISVELPRHRPKGTVVLRGGNVITMRGSEILRNADVVVTGNRIAAVGARGRVAVPEGAEIVNVSGKTIVPGFVDVHAHMWPPRNAHQTQVWQYLANMAYGVTTTRDPQSSTTDVYAYADLVETGEIIGPRVYTTGPGVFSGIGLKDKDGVDAYIKRYKDAYKTDTLKQYVVGDRKIRQLVAMACKKYGISPTTEGALDLKLDLSQMIDGYSGNEHSLPIQPIYKDVIEFVAKSKTYYTPTILVAYGGPWAENYFFQNTNVRKKPKIRRYIPKDLISSMMQRRGQWFAPEEYNYKGIAKGAADVVAAGGRVGIGGHGQLQGLGFHWELWAVQSGGMSTMDALRAATIYGAEAIGLQRDVGSIESGKFADIVILDKNPLEDIRNTESITHVMKNGELFDATSMDQLWPEKKKLEPQYWWDTSPTKNRPVAK